jgi:hypothetical protein
MTSRSAIALGVILGVGSLALPATRASAAIVCSRDVCWHVHGEYQYPPDAHVMIHPDDWRWGPGERFAWREHEGRGFWEGERWREW